jgi:ubiquinone/menaquinone biosynthesis C-methylase UbiE
MVKSIAKAVYYRLFRMQLRIRCWCADRMGGPAGEVPLPPAILRFRVMGSLSVDEFLRVGAGCAELIRRELHDVGMELGKGRRALDFGCGCGRTIRWFLGGGGEAEFHGVDVDGDAVEWCKGHLEGGEFHATSPEPPLPYAAEYFDVVYCLSVFTHLNERMQDAWLAELNRVIKPGGALLLTIYGETASERLDAEGRRELRERGIVHRRSKKLKGLVPEWYHTTFHTREYMVKRLGEWFGDIRYRAVPGGEQDIVVMRKLLDQRRRLAGETEHPVGEDA